MQNNGVIQTQGQTLAVISTEEQASSICIVVYVTKHCATCEYADQVVDTICRDFPQVDVRIVDLEITLEAIPEVVFATPTYLLNGRIWSLGSYIPYTW